MNDIQSGGKESFRKNSLEVHRKQSFWQIGVPLGIAVLAVILLMVYMAVSTAQNAAYGSLWASISTIFLIIPVLIAGLILLMIISAMVLGLAKGLSVLPRYLKLAEMYIYQAEEIIIQTMNKSVIPIIQADSWFSGVIRIVKIIKGK